MSYGLPRAHEYENEIILLKARAEKAEAENAKLKAWLDDVTDFNYYHSEHYEARKQYEAWREGQKNG